MPWRNRAGIQSPPYSEPQQACRIGPDDRSRGRRPTAGLQGRADMQVEPAKSESQALFDRAGIEVVPVSEAIGAEVRGVDLSAPLSDAAFAAIHRAWLDHLVLLFRDQDLTDGDMVAFSRRFGGLDLCPVDENGLSDVEGFPEILVVSNVLEKGKPIGALGASESVWHTDMSYVEAPPKASALYSLERSEERRVGKECVRTCRSRWSPYH